jgi:hypothetical protein
MKENLIHYNLMNLTAQRKMMVSDGGGGNGVSLDGLL